MIQKIIIIGLTITLFITNSTSQTVKILREGVIQFEKTVNMNYYDDLSSYSFFERTLPHFKVFHFDLLFGGNRTLYQPSKDFINNTLASGRALPAIDNIVFTDFNNSISTATKNVYEKAFLVEDSVTRPAWKLIKETRDIIGFNCRRADVILHDSIYVIAFYTDEIAISGGPESFLGLPGMILGLALPRDHVTWFATKFSLQQVPDLRILKPLKGEPVSSSQFHQEINESAKFWGEFKSQYLRSIQF